MKTPSNLLVLITTILLLFSACTEKGRDIAEIKLIPVKNGKNYQYVDLEGKIVINPQFKEATIFRSGLALVQAHGDNPKWGFITEDGKYKINPVYLKATVFSDGLAWVVSENGAPSAINDDGESKVTLKEAETVKIYKEGLAAFSIIEESGREKWGFVDKKGKITINAQFSTTSNFSNGKCAVENTDGKWGYINNKGGLIIPYQFDDASEFLNESAVVSLNKKKGTINKEGKYLINPQFDNIILDGEINLIWQDGKCGWVDKQGKIIITPQFDYAFPFHNNRLSPVLVDNSWAYIDRDGKFIINPQFDFALPFNGEAAVVSVGEKIGFIDADGKYVINPQFDEVSEDLINYMGNGSSKFESVNTDFFNIGAIVNRVNLVSPEGLSLNSKLSEIVTFARKRQAEVAEETYETPAPHPAEEPYATDTFGVEAEVAEKSDAVSGENLFDYSQEHNIFSNERITKDASLAFFVIADAYREVADGWYTKKVFNPNAIVNGYAYTISLSGKGNGKEKEVITAIKYSIKGYKKDDSLTTDNVTVYRKGNQLLKLFYNGSKIVLLNIKEDQP